MGPVRLFKQKMPTKLYCGPYMKNGWLFFSLVIHNYVCSVMRSYCHKIFVYLGSTYGPKVFFLHILGLNIQISYQIASLFHMYIDMGERIADHAGRCRMPGHSR